ncbi:MAG: flagellar basal-body MS-ring/collar protein FliF [Alphaproteobacteria bacterium]
MNSFFDTLRQLGATRLSIMAGIVISLLVFFVFISMKVSEPAMKLLYADLAPGDSAAVAAKLDESQIEYEVSTDGNRISVPSTEVGRSRLLLAEAGLPNGGSMGYEIFDKDAGFGTTNFVQNVNQVRALEGELARTVGSMGGVRNARVHLVLPQRELFSRDTKKSSASVFLNLRPGANIEREKIMAIQSLISSAVPDLPADRVSIIDNNGNLLARGEGDASTNLVAMKAEEMRRTYEEQLTGKVEDQVGRIVGYGAVRASVTAEMNFDRISTNEEVFDPEGQVVRSSQTTEESNTEREAAGGGDVSVEGNLPGAEGLLSEQPSAQGNRTEEVTNFEINKTVRNTVREVGEITKLSVAVLVDGRYTTAEDGAKTYAPRPQEELDRITALVRSAVGFNEERGDNIEVVNLQFAAVDTNEEFTDDRVIFGFEKDRLIDFAEILVISLIVLLAMILVLRPMINKLLAVQPGAGGGMAGGGQGQTMIARQQQNPALAGPPGSSPASSASNYVPREEEILIDIQGIEGKVRASAVKKVEEIVENYPNEAISVIRTWMTQET